MATEILRKEVRSSQDRAGTPCCYGEGGNVGRDQALLEQCILSTTLMNRRPHPTDRRPFRPFAGTGVSSTSGGGGDRSHSATDREPFCSGTKVGPESSAVSRFYRGSAFGRQRGYLSAFVAEILLRDGELLLANTASL